MTESSALTCRYRPMTRLIPYLVIAAVCIFCHGLILTNDGAIWDSWYIMHWLKTSNWMPLDEFLGAAGMPLHALWYRMVRITPDIVSGFMWLTMTCLIVIGCLHYHLAFRLCELTQGEALAIAVLAAAMPVFSAAQELAMLFYIFTYTFFLIACSFALTVTMMSGWKHWLLRVLTVTLFFLSFVNAALLVFYGGFYLLLLLRHRRLQGGAFLPTALRFILTYPDLFLLPAITWIARLILTPQYGWYASYNMPSANLPRIHLNLWSFVENVVPFHVKSVAFWITDHIWAAGLLILILLTWFRFAPTCCSMRRSLVSIRGLALFGFLLLFFAIFPFAAAGKHFTSVPIGEDSHHLLLVGLPLAILVLAALRTIFLSGLRTTSRMLPAVVGCLAFILGIQVIPVYLAEQSDWIFSRSLLHNAARNSAVRTSSILLLQGFSVTKQYAFGIYGFATAFDELTRFVTPVPPENQRFYTPSEIGRTLLRTTILPNEFKLINPSGQQLLIVAERKPGAATDWDIVWRYQKLRWFGTERELDGLLSSLCALKTAVIKPNTPLVPAQPPVGAPEDPPRLGIPTGDFVNAAGMKMVFVPWGWWAGKFEVTQGQYEGVMATNPSLFKDPLRPVECVTWNDATEFCRRLTDLETKAGRLPRGFVYRLPSAEEFDQFAAGGSLRDAVTSALEIRWHTSPVGSLPPNSLGLHDAVGNVWEWSLDWGDEGHRFKLSTGGSWVNYASELTSYPGPREGLGPYETAATERLYGPLRRDYPTQGFWDRGFRCVLAPERTATVIARTER